MRFHSVSRLRRFSSIKNCDPQKFVCYGGGVIGSGWASRFLLNGKDVTIIDKDPEAERKARAVLANATRAMDELIPGFSKFRANDIGELKVVPVGDLAQKALRECEFIQESLPENKFLKNVAYAYMEESCGSDVM